VEDAAVFRIWELTSLKIGEERSKIVNKYQSAGYAHGKKLIFADPEYLRVFTFPLREGNPKTALVEPFSVLITEQAAAEYFPQQDPIGQIIQINDKIDCRITGILQTLPQNTQLYCDFIVSYSTLERLDEEIFAWDQFESDYVYLLLDERADPAVVAHKIPAIIGKNMSPEEAAKYSFRLHHLPDIYFNVLGSGNRGEIYPAGEASFIYSVGLVALFILLLAIANFINLSTARSADRMMEVGIRKTMGAFRLQLIRQYLGESVIMALISMFIGVLLYEVLKLKANEVLPREALADFYNNPIMLVSVIVLVLAIGIFAGFYPALYLSRFSPIAVLQGKFGVKSSKSLLRKTLVIIQFTIAIVFIFCTTIVIRQIKMMTSMNLGFDTENILIIDFEGERATENCRLVKNEILQNNRVLSATACNCPPGRKEYWFGRFYPDENRNKEDLFVAKLFITDHDFMTTFGLELLEGPGFSKDVVSGTGHELVISESMAKALNMDQPIGSRLYGGGDAFYNIVGLVRDFHGSTLNQGYKSATAIRIKAEDCTSLAVKLSGEDLTQSIAGIKETWDQTMPGYQFDYSFLDMEISHNYDEYRSQSKAFLVLAFFAITIACLGVFGLVSYTAERRTKELGIRKVLGASATGIVSLLTKEFVILIAIANAIAFPFGYLLMTDFLRWFPFRVGMGPGTFLFVGGTAIFFALLTASFQSIRAALANPVDALRCE